MNLMYSHELLQFLRYVQTINVDVVSLDYFGRDALERVYGEADVPYAVVHGLNVRTAFVVPDYIVNCVALVCSLVYVSTF